MFRDIDDEQRPVLVSLSCMSGFVEVLRPSRGCVGRECGQISPNKILVGIYRVPENSGIKGQACSFKGMLGNLSVLAPSVANQFLEMSWPTIW